MPIVVVLVQEKISTGGFCRSCYTWMREVRRRKGLFNFVTL